MIVDTTFVIDVMRKDEVAVSRANGLVADAVPLIIGTPTVFELYVGISMSVRSASERERVLAVLKSLNQLPLDTNSAARAGRIYGQRLKEGKKVDPEDAMIAGIAIENNQVLLTSNTRDFQGIPELKIETY